MNNEEVVLGIDYGEKNIGIAFGKNKLVCPLKIVSGRNIQEALNEICKISIYNKITKVVLGLPTDYEGKETAQSKKTRVFAKYLKIRLKKPVQFVDEYGSSAESLEESIDFGVPQKGRKMIDHFSAAVILSNYFKQPAASS